MKILNKSNWIIFCCLLLTVAIISSTVLVNAHRAEENKLVTTNSVETRCGWFENPTPANAWLRDKDGEWAIAVQGGHQADGDWPSFKPNQWVKTNGSYGYGCACMQVTVNRETKEVLAIKSSVPRPLSTCRKDKALKEHN